MAVTWVQSSIHNNLPFNAVESGKDKDGNKLFVGRTVFNGDVLPVKIIPKKRQALVSHSDKEHSVTNFEVMCQPTLHWQPTSGGVIPPGAIEGGKTRTGETLYIGRVHHDHSITVGKVHPSHKTLYIGYYGEERKYSDYEILVLK